MREVCGPVLPFHVSKVAGWMDGWTTLEEEEEEEKGLLQGQVYLAT